MPASTPPSIERHDGIAKQVSTIWVLHPQIFAKAEAGTVSARRRPLCGCGATENGRDCAEWLPGNKASSVPDPTAVTDLPFPSPSRWKIWRYLGHQRSIQFVQNTMTNDFGFVVNCNRDPSVVGSLSILRSATLYRYSTREVSLSEQTDVHQNFGFLPRLRWFWYL
jgi:hypothetical protein